MIFLIRHGMVDACGRFLAGRLPGIRLNDEGRHQAAALKRALGGSIAAVYCGPLERVRETAGAIAPRGVSPCVLDDLDEIDFGEWTGLAFDDLNQRPDWIAFNRHRSNSPIPGGEGMRDVQMRACRALGRIHRAHGGEPVALVSHGDVIRALVATIVGVPLDRLDGFRIDPGSISALEPASSGFVLAHLNRHAYCDHCRAAHA